MGSKNPIELKKEIASCRISFYSNRLNNGQKDPMELRKEIANMQDFPSQKQIQKKWAATHLK